MVTATATYETVFTYPGETDVVATRVFDAPREMVWRAHTKPEHVARWLLGPGGWTMTMCEIDLRPGGGWHWVWAGRDGEDLEMRGEYREVSPPERLVNTEQWGGGWPETLNTMTLAEKDGRTTLTSTVHYPSGEARDRALATGMEDGWAGSYDHLDEYLPSME